MNYRFTRNDQKISHDKFIPERQYGEQYLNRQYINNDNNFQLSQNQIFSSKLNFNDSNKLLPEEFYQLQLSEPQILNSIEIQCAEQSTQVSLTIDEFNKKLLMNSENLKNILLNKIIEQKRYYINLVEKFQQKAEDFEKSAQQKLNQLKNSFDLDGKMIDHRIDPIQRELRKVQNQQEYMKQKEVLLKELTSWSNTLDLKQLKSQLQGFKEGKNLINAFDRNIFLDGLKQTLEEFSRKISLIQNKLGEISPNLPTSVDRNSKSTSFMELNFSRERDQRTSLFTAQENEGGFKNNLALQLQKGEFRGTHVSPERPFRSARDQSWGWNLQKIDLNNWDSQSRSKSPSKQKDPPSFYKQKGIISQGQRSVSPRSDFSGKIKNVLSNYKNYAVFPHQFKYSFIKYKQFFLANHYIECFDYNENNSIILAGTRDGSLLTFSLSTPQSYIKPSETQFIAGQIKIIKIISWSDVLVATKNRQSYLINYNPTQSSQQLIYNCKHPVLIIWSQDISFFIIGTENNKIYIYDTGNAQPVRNFNFADQGLVDFVLTNNNTLYVATGQSDLQHLSLDFHSKKLALTAVQRVKGRVNFIQQIPNNDKILILNCQIDGIDELLVYNTTTQIIMQSLKTQNQFINAQLIYSSLWGNKEVWIITFNEQGKIYNGNLNGQFLSEQIQTEWTISLQQKQQNQNICILDVYQESSRIVILDDGKMTIYELVV